MLLFSISMTTRPLLKLELCDPLSPMPLSITHRSFENIALMLDVIFFSRYGLFASVSTILKTNMGKYLKDIVKYMIESLQSTEGIVVS